MVGTHTFVGVPSVKWQTMRRDDMPGAYAHITLVNIARETRRLEAVAGFPPEAILALQRHLPFCELGAVSPDYPYLAIANEQAKQWADAMHYTNTGVRIKIGITETQKLTGADRLKAFAWLAGYAAHMITDVTIHPVVELKVGPYEQNKTAHRICEMHQDAHIYRRLKLGPIGMAEHLDSGIGKCNGPRGPGQLDPLIASLWKKMLEQSAPQGVALAVPDVDLWHRSFVSAVDKIEEGGKLFPLARHLAVNCGLTYPDEAQIEQQYIAGLRTPGGSQTYDQIFDGAMKNVIGLWRVLAGAVFLDETEYTTKFGNWNFDTGTDEAGSLVFWGRA
jgi:hypothetical protein